MACFIYNVFSLIYDQFMNGKEVNAMLFAQKEKGQGLVEYALILVLVAIVVIAALTLLGPTISGIFTSINDGLAN